MVYFDGVDSIKDKITIISFMVHPPHQLEYSDNIIYLSPFLSFDLLLELNLVIS